MLPERPLPQSWLLVTEPTRGRDRPSAALAPDAPITEQLRNLANGKLDPIIGSAKDRASHRRILFRTQLCAAVDHRGQG